MRTRSFVRLVTTLAVLSVTSFAYAQAKPRVIDITGNDQMKYSLTTITAKPGETLRVRLKSIGTLPKIVMGHNFVLLAKGTAAAAFADAAASAYQTGYIPPAMKAKVLANTTVVGPGETVEVTFKVPAAPGSYAYLCSFTGHFLAGMKGTLVVKK
jgi:azurin